MIGDPPSETGGFHCRVALSRVTRTTFTRFGAVGGTVIRIESMNGQMFLA